MFSSWLARESEHWKSNGLESAAVSYFFIFFRNQRLRQTISLDYQKVGLQFVAFVCLPFLFHCSFGFGVQIWNSFSSIIKWLEAPSASRHQHTQAISRLFPAIGTHKLHSHWGGPPASPLACSPLPSHMHRYFVMDGILLQYFADKNQQVHACIHTYIHTCIHAYMHTCMHSNGRAAFASALSPPSPGRQKQNSD